MRAPREEFVEIDAAELRGVFTPPGWLRDVGISAWLLVGITLLLVGAVWLLSLVHTIVLPVITAGVIAAVASPVVAWLRRRGLARGAGAAVVMLGVVVLGVALAGVVLAGVGSQTSELSDQLQNGADKIAGWAEDAGVDAAKAESAKQDVSDSLSAVVPALLNGLGTGIQKLSSLAFFLSLTALSLFFLLKDGPVIRAWGERHLGVPPSVAHAIGARVLAALRGYFAGVTAVAVFNAVVVGLGALLLGVPLPGTIAVVTFAGAYIPYLGAWGAGAFSVMLALGGAGTDAALGMIVVQLLANGILQQLVQPIAMGSALGIHPLAVLVVTIAGGSLFGAVGLILAAPLTAAGVRVAADLARARAQGEMDTGKAQSAPAGSPDVGTATGPS